MKQRHRPAALFLAVARDSQAEGQHRFVGFVQHRIGFGRRLQLFEHTSFLRFYRRFGLRLLVVYSLGLVRRMARARLPGNNPRFAGSNNSGAPSACLVRVAPAAQG